MQHAGAGTVDLTILSDGELFGLAQHDPPSVFRAIMQRHNRRLFRLARAILGNEAEAEDALQEAYVRAFSALNTFRGEASLATWLTRIVMNEALGQARRRRRCVDLDTLDTALQQGESQVIVFPTLASTGDPEWSAARAEIRHLLEQAIDELPDPFRLVFIMRDVEDMSTEETANALGIRPETVKTRLHRARRLLRKALNDRLATALVDVFPFAGARCARITEQVMDRLGAAMGPSGKGGLPSSS